MSVIRSKCKILVHIFILLIFFSFLCVLNDNKSITNEEKIYQQTDFAIREWLRHFQEKLDAAEVTEKEKEVETEEQYEETEEINEEQNEETEEMEVQIEETAEEHVETEEIEEQYDEQQSRMFDWRY